MEMLHHLGIDWAKIVAQILIFGIVYLILKRYAFGPVTAMLEQRRQRIAEGEANLVTIRQNLAASEQQAKEIIDRANADADRIIKEAKDSAAAIAEQRRQEAIAEAQAIVAKAREATELERSRVLEELKRDFARLVIDTTSKVTGKVLTEEDRARLNKESLSQIAA